MSEEANPFVIGQTGDGESINVSRPAQLRSDGGSSHHNNTAETDVESEDIHGLIPLCVQHATGPKLSTTTFGYDIVQMQKHPWREPGARLEDYFNYGFNEKSWRVYCAMQKDGSNSLLSKASEMLQKLEQSAHGQVSTVMSDMPIANGAHRYDVDGGMHGPPPMGYGSTIPPFTGRLRHHAPLPPSPYAPYQDMGGGEGGTSYPAAPYGAYKTKLCQRFAEGRCTRGNECNYAHGVSELRTASGLVGYGHGSRTPQPTPVGVVSGYEYAGEMRQDGGGSGVTTEMQAYPMPPYQGGAEAAPSSAYMPEGLLRRESSGFGDAESGSSTLTGSYYRGPCPPKRIRPDQDRNYNASYGGDSYA